MIAPEHSLARSVAIEVIGVTDDFTSSRAGKAEGRRRT